MRNQPDTRHSHGGVWHDHEGGGVRHDHEGLPVSGTRNPYRGEAMLAIGVAIAVLGGIALLWQSGNHSACGSVLVQGTSQGSCQTDNFIWTAGLIGLIVGVALLIAGAIMRSRS